MIITNKAVDKTFKGDDCLLFREIVSVRKVDNSKTFVIRTYRANYIDVIVGQDENENDIVEQQLKLINVKDQDVVRRYSYDMINALWNAIKGGISFGTMSYMEVENKAEQLALFQENLTDLPFGTNQEDWELFDSEITIIR